MSNYEEKLKELNELINKMENENLTLEQNIEYFEKANKLYLELKQDLKCAQLKVEKIIKESSDIDEDDIFDVEE